MRKPLIASLILALPLSTAVLPLSGAQAARQPRGEVRNAAGVRVIEQRYGQVQREGIPAARAPQEAVVVVEDGVEYGWSLRIDPARPVRITEVLTLPAKANWEVNVPGRKQISRDGRTCTVEMTLTPDAQGWISNVWTVAPGDPLGQGACSVTIEDGEPLVFPVRFVRPGQEPAEPPAALQPAPAEPPSAPVVAAPATRPTATTRPSRPEDITGERETVDDIPRK